jgi:pimeloyl-ACP methyl ester carboxylesterase
MKISAAVRWSIGSLLVAAGNDPLGSWTDRAEARMIISPHALLSPTSFRRSAWLEPDELGGITAPTLVIWGEREPLGGVEVACDIVGSMPDARLELLDAGHGPWLGHAPRIAELVSGFVRRGSSWEEQPRA